MTPTPDQLRLCAYLMEHPEVPWQWNMIANRFKDGEVVRWTTSTEWTPWDAITNDRALRIHPNYAPPTSLRYSLEGKDLLILHNHDCDQFGVITGESPEHLWFTRHGGHFKLSKDSGEVETLKPAEF
jgi:hypothetical protein